MQPTHDPHVFLVSAAPGELVYGCPSSGERWVIRGTCVHCGACYSELPLPLPPIGIEHVVRPEISKLDGCTLTGEYL